MKLQFIVFALLFVFCIGCTAPTPQQFSSSGISFSFTGYNDMQITSNDDEIFNCFNENIGVCVHLTDADGISNIDSLMQSVYNQKTQNLALDTKSKIVDDNKTKFQNSTLTGFIVEGNANKNGINWVFVTAKAIKVPLVYFVVISYTDAVDDAQLKMLLNSLQCIAY